MRAVMILLLAGLVSACSHPRQEVTGQLTHQVLLPAHQQWHDSNAALLVATQGYCASELDLAALKQSFYRSLQGWAHLQPLMIGPLAEGNRSWQVQFWPDKRNLVARQVEALLDAASSLDQQALENGSVVVQGLSAFEYVVFDDSVDLEKQSERYCPLLTGIARHQVALSAQVLSLWEGPDGMTAMLTTFPNARFANVDEALGSILRTQITAVDTLKKKLGVPMGRLNKGVPQPWQAEAWRSQHSISNLQASLSGARAVWERVRSLVGDTQLVTRIDAAYENTAQKLAGLSEPLVLLVQHKDNQLRLQSLYDSLDNLETLQQIELARDLGIQLGFNANDGD
ncbi:MAG: imelysin family protein [Alcanivorax sediminis]|uniref:Imelysin n=1 Tax=Alcanivorax sediminis TaxID=2663008 RepID=A0A6N7LQC5_9GAMM|nr:imelysin family protein [Alcanivorax sediminis]MQX52489.1 imelysin [Alcanivorax sediminis]